MGRATAFTDREVFEQMVKEITAADGSAYKDIQTIYGDLSRLAVGWLAKTPIEKLIGSTTILAGAEQLTGERCMKQLAIG